jgi:hypothetical protein
MWDCRLECVETDEKDWKKIVGHRCWHMFEMIARRLRWLRKGWLQGVLGLPRSVVVVDGEPLKEVEGAA